MNEGQRPLQLILARNLMAMLSTPAFLVDEEGVLVFYNDAAGAVLGKASRGRPHELRRMDHRLRSVRQGRRDARDRGAAAHHRLAATAPRSRASRFAGSMAPSTIHVSAIPIVSTAGSGAMAIFWPVEGE